MSFLTTITHRQPQIENLTTHIQTRKYKRISSNKKLKKYIFFKPYEFIYI